MKDLDSLRYFLSTEVTYLPIGYLLFQSKYIVDILEQARLTNNKTVDTLIKVNTKYSSSDDLPCHILLYTVLLLGAWYISLLLIQILHMLFMLLVRLLLLLLMFIRQLFFVFCDIFEVQFFKVFYFYPSLS